MKHRVTYSVSKKVPPKVISAGKSLEKVNKFTDRSVELSHRFIGSVRTNVKTILTTSFLSFHPSSSYLTKVQV